MAPNAPIQFVAWLDTWAVSATLRRHLDKFEDDVLPVRDGTGLWAFECRKEWPSLWNLLQHLQRHPAAAEADPGPIRLERLQPKSATPWRYPDVDNAWIEARIALVTNPSCYLFAGTQAVHAPIGHVCLLAGVWPRCAVNWGDTASFSVGIELIHKPVN